MVTAGAHVLGQAVGTAKTIPLCRHDRVLDDAQVRMKVKIMSSRQGQMQVSQQLPCQLRQTELRPAALLFRCKLPQLENRGMLSMTVNHRPETVHLLSQ